jgi:hypothetical protein
MPTHANGPGPPSTPVGVMVSGLVSENLHDMHRYQKRMHQESWYMSITPQSTVYCVEQISHKTCSAHSRRKGIKDHPLYHHHDPYNNAIAIDECFDASDHVRYGWTHKSEAAKTKKDRPQRLSLLFLPFSRHGVVLARLVKGRGELFRFC